MSTVISLPSVLTHAKLEIFESDCLQVSCIRKPPTATHFIAHSQPWDVPRHIRHLRRMTLPLVDTVSRHGHSPLLSDARTTAMSFYRQSPSSSPAMLMPPATLITTDRRECALESKGRCFDDSGKRLERSISLPLPLPVFHPVMTLPASP